MNPHCTPNASRSTLATGARQFVVHDPLEIIRCSAGSYWPSFTPRTMVRSSSFAGAEIRTRFAPAARGFSASARLVPRGRLPSPPRLQKIIDEDHLHQGQVIAVPGGLTLGEAAELFGSKILD